MSAGVTVLVAVATGMGAALVGDRYVPAALDHFLGGAVYGLVGGLFLLLVALWWLTRESVVDEVTGVAEVTDAGAVLFWATIVGALMCGSWGGAAGLGLKVAVRNEVLGGAFVAGLFAMVPAVVLRRRARYRRRNTAAAFRERD